MKQNLVKVYCPWNVLPINHLRSVTNNVGISEIEAETKFNKISAELKTLVSSQLCSG